MAVPRVIWSPAWFSQVLAVLAGLLAAALVGAIALKLTGRAVLRRLLARFTRRLFSDPYHENLWETVTGLRRFGVQAVVETELRAASGQLLLRPLGRFRGFPGFDALLFDPAQLARMPTPEDLPVELSTVLGARAERPLRIDLPVLITGMGYAVALSPQAKEALARGATLAGTATNTGEGPLYPGERRAARSLIIQYNRGGWNDNPEIMRQADMIQIQFGQGALGGSPVHVPDRGFPPELRAAFGMRPGQKGAWIHSRLPGVERPSDLRDLVADLRGLTGVPIGVKLAAGDRIEADLEIVLRAGVDCVTVDGAEGGTHGAPPVLGDDFGLPSFIALCRASRFLAGVGAAERPNLVVSGGFFSPGLFLKALALGADAVAIGTAALFALGHAQTSKAVPWEPPLDIVFYGRPSSRRLNVERAARSLARYLNSVALELAAAVRVLGKTSVHQVDRGDLFALEPWVADLAGVRLAAIPRDMPAVLNSAVEAQLQAWGDARTRLDGLLSLLSR